MKPGDEARSVFTVLYSKTVGRYFLQNASEVLTLWREAAKHEGLSLQRMSDATAHMHLCSSAELRPTNCSYCNDIVWRGTILVMAFLLQIAYLMHWEGGPCGFSLGSEWT